MVVKDLKTFMKAYIEIKMDNAAFEDGANGALELSRILEELVFNLRNGNYVHTLKDGNGNTVGRIDFYSK